ncbi:acyl carrier protein [Parabacteroides sp. ZJ-118]|uniref:acyl carrier protein n=1 Tax=Parabacteroides sp. ZJ-118 TaxID=2709398 RepID=UPI0013ED6EA4|nr:acyl carrier protein [Parabacteroides sp. ZJ-118]
METTKFIESFAEALEIEDASKISVETEFRKLDEWDSLGYLNIIAMLDEKYGIQIENVQFKQLITIEDLIRYIDDATK